MNEVASIGRSKPEYGPALKGDQLRYVSPSAITTFSPDQEGGCHRKWFFEKKLGRKPPTTKAQQTGITEHAEIASYLVTGVDRLGPIAREGKRFLPRPGSDLIVEREFGQYKEALAARDRHLEGLYDSALIAKYALTLFKVPLMGAMDVRHRRGEWVDDNGQVICEVDPLTGEVGDWKTTSSISDWAKGPEQLVKTVQMPLYAAVLVREWPDLRAVRISHGYFGTKRREAKKTSIVMHRDLIERRKLEIERTVLEMTQVAREFDVSKVEANLGACDAFRGCPHRDYCDRPARTLMHALGLVPKGEPMSDGLFDFMKGNGVQTTPPAIPKEELERNATIEAERQRLLAEEAPLPQNYGFCNQCGTALSAANASKLQSGGVKHIGCKVVGILPPDAPKIDPVLAADPLPAEAAAAITDPALKSKVEAHAVAHATKNPEETKVKGGRCEAGGQSFVLTQKEIAGRKKNCPVCAKPMTIKDKDFSSDFTAWVVPSHNRAKAEAEAPVASMPAPASPPPVIPSVVTATPQTIQETFYKESTAPPVIPAPPMLPVVFTTGGITLYVDVILEKGAAKSLDTWFQDLVSTIEKRFNILDIRLASNDTDIGYGRWKGLLSAMVKGNPLPPGEYILHGVAGSEVKQVVVEALSQVCERVVRGGVR